MFNLKPSKIMKKVFFLLALTLSIGTYAGEVSTSFDDDVGINIGELENAEVLVITPAIELDYVLQAPADLLTITSVVVKNQKTDFNLDVKYASFNIKGLAQKQNSNYFNHIRADRFKPKILNSFVFKNYINGSSGGLPERTLLN